jgi:demethoxyubiquinone hydroxylase (CLK1/Coq7/Cat5 family)
MIHKFLMILFQNVYVNISYYLIEELMKILERHYEQHLENNENLFYLSILKKIRLKENQLKENYLTLASNKSGFLRFS